LGATVLLLVVGSALVAWRLGLMDRWAELGSQYVARTIGGT
jgi:hypothetical protein